MRFRPPQVFELTTEITAVPKSLLRYFGCHCAGLLWRIGEDDDACLYPKRKASILVGLFHLAHLYIDSTRNASSRDFPRAARIDKDRCPIKPQSIYARSNIQEIAAHEDSDDFLNAPAFDLAPIVTTKRDNDTGWITL
jgi:hypothetical protein